MLLGTRVLSLLLSLCFVPLAAPARAQTPQFDRFLVFGDSLVDTGNVWLTSRLIGTSPAPPPSISPHHSYDDGRFSNGPIFIEHLWSRFNGGESGSARRVTPYLASPLLLQPAVSFAFGGTGTATMDETPGGLRAPGLKGQVLLYRTVMGSRVPSPRTLFLIMVGANDYLDAGVASSPVLPVPVVVGNIADAATMLYQGGARTIAIAGLPNLGRLPYLAPEVRAALADVTRDHNAALVRAVGQLQRKLRGARVIYLDLEEAFAAFPASMNPEVPAIDVLMPPQNGFPFSSCLFVDPSLCVDLPLTPPASFLFWDVVHPTTEAHRLIADYIYPRLAP